MHELSNPASREGYADDWEVQATGPELDGPEFTPEGERLPHHAKPYHRYYPVDRPVAVVECEGGKLTKRYQTPGPGPSAGIPKACLELSKIEKQIEDARLAIKQSPVRASNAAASVKFSLQQIEKSVNYLKERCNG